MRFSKKFLHAAIVALSVTTALNAEIRWNTVGGDWSDHSSWTPAVVPGLGDDAKIGVTDAIQGDVVLMDRKAIVNKLFVDNGAILDNGGRRLTVVDDARLNGESDFTTTLRIHPAPGFGSDFAAKNLFIEKDGMLEIHGEADARVTSRLVIDTGGTLSGEGFVEMENPVGNVYGLDNSGEIRATGDLVIRGTGNNRLLLDGSAATGKLIAESPGATIGVSGGTHWGQFDGKMRIGSGNDINLHFDEPWKLSHLGEITFTHNPHQPAAGFLRPHEATLAGQLTVADDAHGVVNAAELISITETTQVSTQTNSELDLMAKVVVNGGHFNSDLSSDSHIDFLSKTTWAGTITNDGRIFQNGPATVSKPTVINGGIFDLDGHHETTEWNVNQALTLNVDLLDADPVKLNRFHGKMNIGDGLFGKAIVNLPDASIWEMAGEMNLSGNIAGALEKLAGSPMNLTGNLNVAANVIASADIKFNMGSVTSLPKANDQLRLPGASTIAGNAEFSGEGLLRNTGTMVLLDESDTNQVGLVNDSLLQIGDGSAAATVGSFLNTNKGTLMIDLATKQEKTTSDELLVASDAELSGTLAISMVEGVELYKSLAIISAANAVSGQFGKIETHGAPSNVGVAVTYDTHSVNATAALLGDTNLDGSVEFSDFLQLSGNFGEAGSWLDGDFDGDGTVAFSDFLGLSANFGESVPSISAVPEPGGMALASCFCLLLTLRRRK